MRGLRTFLNDNNNTQSVAAPIVDSDAGVNRQPDYLGGDGAPDDDDMLNHDLHDDVPGDIDNEDDDPFGHRLQGNLEEW